ncbi:NAD(P)-binding protein [Hortaea werneckii]|nr:NAD(P)-binding protein [Hortaea werneckii]
MKTFLAGTVDGSRYGIIALFRTPTKRLAILTLFVIPSSSSLLTLLRNHIQNPTIDSQNLTINILILGQEQHTHAHLLILAPAHQRHMALIRDLLRGQMALLVLVALLGRHLAGEVARGDGVDADAGLLELRGHELGEVHGGGFGRVVGEVALREGEEGEGGEVDACDVGVEGRLPVRYAFTFPELLLQVAGVCFVRLSFGSGDPGVAHEHVDVGLLLRKLVDDPLEVFFLGDVAGTEGDDGAAAFSGRVVGLGGFLESFYAAPRDVDFGAVGSEGLGGHQPNA